VEVAPEYEAGSLFLAFIRKQVGVVHVQNNSGRHEAFFGFRLVEERQSRVKTVESRIEWE
jgi:hypothetical protein